MSQALISQFLIGISVAAILAIAAIGLAVIFGVAGVINMAHGQFIMVGAYTAAVVGQLGGNTFIAIPIAFIVVAAVGLVVERGVIQFLYERPLETLLATWGVGIILEVLMKAIFGPELYYVGAPRVLDGGVRIIGVSFARMPANRAATGSPYSSDMRIATELNIALRIQMPPHTTPRPKAMADRRPGSRSASRNRPDMLPMNHTIMMPAMMRSAVADSQRIRSLSSARA